MKPSHIKLLPWKSTFAASAAIFASGIVSSVLLARFLGPENRGDLTAVTFWAHSAAGFASLGLNEVISMDLRRRGMTAVTVPTILFLSLAIAAVSTVLLVTLNPILLSSNRTELRSLFIIYSAVFLPTTLIAQNFLAIEQGQLNFKAFNIQRAIQNFAYPAALLLFIISGHISVETGALSMLVGTILVAALRTSRHRKNLFGHPSLELIRTYLRNGFRLHATTQAMFLAAQADLILLLTFTESSTVGLYVAAQTLSRPMITLVISTYTNISLPYLSIGGNSLEVRGEIKKHIIWILILLLILVVLGYLLVPFVVPLLLGEKFFESIRISQVLILAFALAGFRKTLLYIRRAQNSNKHGFIAEFATAGLIFLLGLASIFRYFPISMELAVLIANVVGTVVMVVFFLNADQKSTSK